jgi:hypothetical protein
MKPDILERLKSYMTLRVGTGNSDVNALAVPLQITWGDAADAVNEIKRLRADIIILKQMGQFKERA